MPSVTINVFEYIYIYIYKTKITTAMVTKLRESFMITVMGW